MKVQKDIQFEERFSKLLTRSSDHLNPYLYGVKSTGIFCLPNCPSKRPNRSNVIFFESVSEALESGFRACKRCKPQLGLNLAVEDIHEKIIQIAIELVRTDNCTKVKDLARALNVSERQLRRIIKKGTGLTPLTFMKSYSER